MEKAVAAAVRFQATAADPFQPLTIWCTASYWISFFQQVGRGSPIDPAHTRNPRLNQDANAVKMFTQALSRSWESRYGQ